MKNLSVIFKKIDDNRAADPGSASFGISSGIRSPLGPSNGFKWTTTILCRISGSPHDSIYSPHITDILYFGSRVQVINSSTYPPPHSTAAQLSSFSSRCLHALLLHRGLFSNISATSRA